MNDPFRTLGVPSTATEEEIKSAYRSLAKKYHPDLNPEDPQGAERKMKEINEAYAEAMRIKKGGGTYQSGNYGSSSSRGQGSANSGGYGQYGNRNSGYSDPFGFGFGFGPFGGFESRTGQNGQTYGYRARTKVYDDAELQAAAEDISAGRYQNALQLLNRMTAHDAAWHYLSALANRGMGNLMAALNHARSAVRLDPDDPEYRSLLESLEGPGTGYRQSSGRTGGFNPSCMTVWAACLLFQCCMGRGMPFFFCC